MQKPANILVRCCDSGQELTWEVLWRSANYLAKQIIPANVAEQSVMLLPCFGDIELYPMLLACWMRGLIPFPVNPGLQRSELHSLAQHMLPGAQVFFLDKYRDNAEMISRELGISMHPCRPFLDNRECISPSSVGNYVVSGNRFSLLMATSGSSGKPKLVVFNENEILSGLEILRQNEPAQVERFLSLRPQFAAAGLYTFWPCLLWDRTLLLSEQALRFPQVNWFLQLLNEQRPATVSAPLAYLKSIARFLGASLEDMSYGRIVLHIVGEKPSRADIEEILKIYPFHLMVRYSMTECIHAICKRAADVADFSDVEKINVGPPLSGFDLKIGNTVQIKSLGMSHAVIRDSKIVKTQPDLWRLTDDAAVVSPDGRLLLYGRGPSWICSSGFRFSSFEIEEVLCRHDAVTDVAVIGVGDARRGEVPIAFLVLRSDIDEKSTLNDIQKLCGERLSHRKVPARFIIIKEIPQTASGKRDWKKLLELWEAGGSH